MRPGVPPARTFVTGIGVMTPIGCTLEEYWNALLEGESGIAPLPGGPGLAVRVAGQISEPVSYAVPSRVAVQTDRWTHLAMTAAVAALADAGIRLEEHSAYDLSVHTASSSGGNEFGQREIQALWAEGPDLVGPYQSIAWFYAATTGQLSIRHGMKGWSGVLVAEQAGGLDAFAQARRALRQGSRAVLTGATEAPLSPYALTCQLASGQVSTRDDPRRAYRPFRSDASGFVPGEGGAVLVVEPEPGARPYGEILGHASTFDPAPGSGRPPGLLRAITGALDDAGVSASDIDVVFADALGVPDADRTERDVLAEVFGRRAVPVTTTKPATGRMAAGSAALDVATALLALLDGLVPPVAGGEFAADGLDLVTGRPRRTPVCAALVLARGYGGFNSALVLAGAGTRGKEWGECAI